MTVWIPLTWDKFLMLISVYATTLTSEEDVKASLYNLLNNIIDIVLACDKFVMLESFNRSDSREHFLWNGILAQDSIRKCNTNGQLLLDLCTKHELIISNFLFCFPT